MRQHKRSRSALPARRAESRGSSELQPVIVDQQVVDVIKEQKNHATELIEDFMIAANGVVARMLEKVSSLRRIVRTPEHWDRIVQLAAVHGEKLPRATRLQGAQRLPAQAQSRRSGVLCGAFSGGDQG